MQIRRIQDLTLFTRGCVHSLLRHCSWSSHCTSFSVSGLAMSHQWCDAHRIVLPILAYLTILCSSFGLTLSSETAGPTTSYDNTQLLVGNHKFPSHRKSGEVFPAAANSTNILTSSSLLSPYQSGCRIVLRSYTVWPGPSVLTATDTTICPSLASTTLVFICCSICGLTLYSL